MRGQWGRGVRNGVVGMGKMTGLEKQLSISNQGLQQSPWLSVNPLEQWFCG